MNVKNILIACAIAAYAGQMAYAADDSPSKRWGFAYLAYAPTAQGGSIEGYQFDDTDYLGLGLGYVSKKPRSIGYYMDIKFTPDIVSGSGNSDLIYRYLMLNVGVTFNLADRFALLGGIGYSIQDGSVVRDDTHYETEESNADFNVNVGAMFKLTQSFGLVAGYDTSASAYSLGLAIGF
ncbi:MAG: outer membrane beta-barrel protein [Pseudomonadota bacterium]